MKARHGDSITVTQLDGSEIAARLCTCPPFFVRWPFIGSLDCPIDRHRIVYLQATWEWGEDERDTIRDGMQGNER